MVMVRVKNRVEKHLDPELMTMNRMQLALNIASRVFQLQYQQLDPSGRNLDKDCGYPQGQIGLAQYRDMYDRWGIASRVVSVYPDECWIENPDVYTDEDPTVTTRFERTLSRLVRDLKLWSVCHRADVLSGVGSYGGILVGLNDGSPLDKPVVGLSALGRRLPGAPAYEVTYLRPLSEDYLTVSEFEEDETSPRYGLPLMYRLFKQSTIKNGPTGPEFVRQPQDKDSLYVHWHRVVHLADNLESGDVYGVPRLQRVFNYLFDIRKIGGGSAEMFWQGAFPGYAFEVFKELADSVTLDRASVAEEMERFRNRLQRVLTSNAGTWKSLAPQIADPTNHLTQQLNLLCASLGVPLRVFMGSEAAHLASTQDIQTWNRRVQRRQRGYLNDYLIRPLLDRMTAFGALPEVPEYFIDWKDLNSLTDKDKADRSTKLSQSLLQYITSKAFKLVKPTDFLVSFCDFTPRDAKSMVKGAGGEEAILKALDDLVKMEMMPPAQNVPKTNPAKRTGASGRRNAAGKGA